MRIIYYFLSLFNKFEINIIYNEIKPKFQLEMISIYLLIYLCINIYL